MKFGIINNSGKLIYEWKNSDKGISYFVRTLNMIFDAFKIGIRIVYR